MPRTTFTRILTCSAVVVLSQLVACSGETPTDAAIPAAHASQVQSSAAVSTMGKPLPPPAPSTYEIKTASIVDVVSGNTGVVEVLCSSGKKALGGGFQLDKAPGVNANAPDVIVYESSPRVTSGTDGWRLVASNRTADTRTFDVYVICAAL